MSATRDKMNPALFRAPYESTPPFPPTIDDPPLALRILMVHHRINEKEVNPNPHINFITALRRVDSTEDQESARQLLRALAAQVRPVMKSHGFEVNSFEEYEYNSVFAGRNWNNGETVELVLRRPDGSFYPIYWLMSTLCHELAHIKHMDHGPAFQALWSRLRAEVRQLQDKGYYGDGYWSSGTRLSDSTRVGGVGIEAGDFPEYICGGAQSRARPSSGRRKRRATGKRREVVPSLHTGAQTAKKRKAGARVTSKYAFSGEGSKLGDFAGPGTGFGKRANSNKAREERALATERRLRALQGQATRGSLVAAEGDSDESGSEEEYAPIPETDAERRQTLLSSEDSKDISNLGDRLGSRDAWKQFEKDFNFGNVKSESKTGISESTPTGDDKGSIKPTTSGSTSGRSTRVTAIDVIDISSDEDDPSRPPGQGCDVQAPSGSTGTIGARSNRAENPAASQSKSSSTGTSIRSSAVPSSKALGKQKDANASNVAQLPTISKDDSSKLPKEATGKSSTALTFGHLGVSGASSGSTNDRREQSLGLGNLVKTEVEFRKKEAIGLAGRINAGGRTLGSRPSELHGTPGSFEPRPTSRSAPESASNNNDPSPSSQGVKHKWTCLVCTLENEGRHLSCSACATPRGEAVWVQGDRN